jgi:hypothetical protein
MRQAATHGRPAPGWAGGCLCPLRDTNGQAGQRGRAVRCSTAASAAQLAGPANRGCTAPTGAALPNRWKRCASPAPAAALEGSSDNGGGPQSSHKARTNQQRRQTRFRLLKNTRPLPRHLHAPLCTETYGNWFAHGLPCLQWLHRASNRCVHLDDVPEAWNIHWQPGTGTGARGFAGRRARAQGCVSHDCSSCCCSGAPWHTRVTV